MSDKVRGMLSDATATECNCPVAGFAALLSKEMLEAGVVPAGDAGFAALANGVTGGAFKTWAACCAGLPGEAGFAALANGVAGDAGFAALANGAAGGGAAGDDADSSIAADAPLQRYTEGQDALH